MTSYSKVLKNISPKPQVVEQTLSSKPYLFTSSKDVLMELISKRTEALKKFMKRGSTETQELMMKAIRNLLREKCKAKTQLAARICPKLPNQPQGSLGNSFSTHGKFSKTPPKLWTKTNQKQERKVSNKPERKQKYIETHCKTVYNRHATYDPQIIEVIEQNHIKDLLGTTPQKKQIKVAISKMQSDKALGASQFTKNMLKMPLRCSKLHC